MTSKALAPVHPGEILREEFLAPLDMSAYANEKMFRAMGIDLEPDDPEVFVRVQASCGSFRLVAQFALPAAGCVRRRPAARVVRRCPGLR